MGIILSLSNHIIYFIVYLRENIINKFFKKMNTPYSLSNDQMQGIVEDTYPNIINEYKNFKINIFCPNKQAVALLNVIATNFATKNETSGN